MEASEIIIRHADALLPLAERVHAILLKSAAQEEFPQS